MKIGVIGAGSWGTSFAIYLKELDFDVTLWIREIELFQIIKEQRENTYFLPDIIIPENLNITNSLDDATKNKDIIIFAIPVQKLRNVIEQIKIGNEPILINLSKGIEEENLLFPSELIGSYFPVLDFVTLSGPSFAKEFANKKPTLLVSASNLEDTARFIRDSFISQRLRIYSTNDIVGVELGGALKNVIAIASGVISSLNLGENVRSAMITRGLVEIVRLGISLGARIETLFGLSGLGDLILTSTSDLSRNFQFGKLIGNGKSKDEALAEIKGIPEGVWTTNAVLKLAQNFNIEMPITYEVHSMINDETKPIESLKRLMEREPKDEWKDITRLIIRQNNS